MFGYMLLYQYFWLNVCRCLKSDLIQLLTSISSKKNNLSRTPTIKLDFICSSLHISPFNFFYFSLILLIRVYALIVTRFFPMYSLKGFPYSHLIQEPTLPVQYSGINKSPGPKTLVVLTIVA